MRRIFVFKRCKILIKMTLKMAAVSDLRTADTRYHCNDMSGATTIDVTSPEGPGKC